ncbi:MAG: GNAT family N-acetyltransferase [Planctomycetota bacterium]|jgi:ribosomal protein S18 acetylase RimI-like enzyme
MEISLRPNEAGDQQFLWELHRATMGEYVDETYGWNDAEQKAKFDRKYRPGRGEVIEVEGVRVGYLQVVRSESPVHLQQIEIAPEFQGRSIGTRVIEGLGAPVRLRVFKSNPRARRLYERLGFHPTEQIETHDSMERR